VGYFGVKSAKVCRAQMGTKPAKVGRLGPRCAKVRRSPHPAPTGASAKRSSIHAASKVAKVGAAPAGGPKLLKWGRLRARQGQICSKATAGGVSQKGLRSTKEGLRSAGGLKLLKWWGLSGRGSNLLKPDRPLGVYYPRVGGAHSSQATGGRRRKCAVCACRDWDRLPDSRRLSRVSELRARCALLRFLALA